MRRTLIIRVEKVVSQGNSLIPLLFNMVINKFIQHIKKEEYTQLGYSFHKVFYPRHLFQFADDAAVITGQEHENQILLNAFSRWCTWANMKMRVDKCQILFYKKDKIILKTSTSKTLHQKRTDSTHQNRGTVQVPGTTLQLLDKATWPCQVKECKIISEPSLLTG